MKETDHNSPPAAQSPWRTAILRLAFLLMALAGSGLMYLAVGEYVLFRQSRSWPTVAGALSIHTDQYRKNLSYEYSVNGIAYHSERVIFGELGNRTRSARWQSFASRGDGSPVVVHYKPADPEESTLLTEFVDACWFHGILGMVFFLSGILMTVFFPRMLRMTERRKVAERRLSGG